MPTMSAPAALASSALSENRHPLGLAGAVGQHDRATHDLIGLLGIDAQLHRDIDRLVELGLGAFLDQRQSGVDRIELVAVDLAGDRLLALGGAGHVRHPPP
jgi:hypothetical protein